METVRARETSKVKNVMKKGKKGMLVSLKTHGGFCQGGLGQTGKSPWLPADSMQDSQCLTPEGAKGGAVGERGIVSKLVISFAGQPRSIIPYRLRAQQPHTGKEAGE